MEKLTKLSQRLSVAESQQMTPASLIKQEQKDLKIPSYGEDLSSISRPKLESILKYLDDLTAKKMTDIIQSTDTQQLVAIKYYLQALQDVRKIFNNALQSKN